MSGPETQHALAALRRFSRREPALAHCDLCAVLLGDRHAHLFELDARRLLCACTACGLLFPTGDHAERVRVETRVLPLPELQLNEHDWNALDVPVRLLFLCPSARHQRLFAIYPNPQGAVEAQLPFAAWQALLQAHPQLNELEPEVDGLALDGRTATTACARVSIDVCHGLVGRLRSRGQSADQGWREFERGFERLQRGEYA